MDRWESVTQVVAFRGGSGELPEIDVRLVDVTKSFGPDAVAVDHISLDVYDGEFFSLLGPSGCGKTTTLRMIGGFEEPTSGLIELQGQDVTWLPPFKRNVNTVFQNYALFPHLTIYENVAFGLRRRKVSDAEVKKRVPEMLELVELRGFDKRKPGQISGGQAQRVALARALINRPAVLLLDEPLGALDLKLRKQMQVELKRIQQEVGITFIYVTHDQEEAMTMSDRVAVMNRGKYEQLARPGGPVRAAGDPLRGRVPGRQQPAAGTRRGGRWRPTAPSGSTARASSGCPRHAVAGSHPRGCGRAAREDPAAGDDRSGARRCQHPQRSGPERPVHGRQHPVPGRPARRRQRRGLRAELRACPRLAPSGRWPRSWCSRWSPDDTFAVDPPADLRCVRRRDARHGRARRSASLNQHRDPANRRPPCRPIHPTRPHPRCLETPITRRRALQIAAAAGAAAFLGGTTAARVGAQSPAAAGRRTGSFQMATWIGYMDFDENGYSPSLDEVPGGHRHHIDYQEAVKDNEEFFAVAPPGPPADGLPTGWDLVVLTDG